MFRSSKVTPVTVRRVYCTFPKDMIREPLLYNLGKNFTVVPNIRQASITDEMGFVYLELEGDDVEIDRAVRYLVERRVKVEEVKGDQPPGSFAQR